MKTSYFTMINSSLAISGIGKAQSNEKIGVSPGGPADEIGTFMVGKLSGKNIYLPQVNKAPMPSIAASGIVKNGMPLSDFELINTPGQPDVRSYKKKFGLLIPATNTSMEHELWSIIFNNQGAGGLDGVGIHTVNVQTPKARLETEDDLIAYKNQFVGGLGAAIEQAALAQPEYLILGMSLEHILYGLEEIRTLMNKIESGYKYSWATWHDAADAALKKYKAKRIGIISPFDKKGNENAIKMFEDLGYDVVASFGFACGNALDIAHIPDTAKEKAIMQHLATPENNLDAIVQLGTNMSMINVSEKLENKIGIPILGINAVTFWYALRENGFQTPLVKSGRLLAEF
jgi:maleate isomerase